MELLFFTRLKASIGEFVDMISILGAIVARDSRSISKWSGLSSTWRIRCDSADSGEVTIIIILIIYFI